MTESDVLALPLTAEEELVISSDNSGAIGEKKADAVSVPNEVTSYFACRVAYMDLLRTRATPKAIILQNFTSDDAWTSYVEGVRNLLKETTFTNLPITGSTESNFTMLQSGLGLTIVGTRKRNELKRPRPKLTDAFAVIGRPLVGMEVPKQPEHIAPLQLFESFAKNNAIIDLVPVGSKGILAEWQRLTQATNYLSSSLDIKKSGGPATCFIIAYNKKDEGYIKSIAKNYFYPLEVLI